LVSSLLVPPALLWGAVVGWRNRRYDRNGAAQRAPLPVISVGNLTAGGTGKTPFVAWLAQRLAASGAKPAILSRGYGGRAGRGPLVVSRGDGPLHGAALCGDEPLLLARALDAAIVVVGSDRLAGAREAARLGATVALLDDGFQHRRLARDLDVVLLDASNPFGNYRLLPAGLLREPVRGLARADVVLVTRCRRADEPLAVIERVVRHHNPSAPLVRAGHRAVAFVDRRGASVAAPARAIAFCGIGNPGRFRIDLEALGVQLVGFEAHHDHHPWRGGELARLARRAGEHDAALITTEKDLARLDDTLAAATAPARLLALRIESEVWEPRPLLERVATVLELGPAGR
jgi:tetraacyldisaccharide 4'-kinase